MGPRAGDFMHILLSNDDGYRAPGLVRLAEAIADLGTVSVVAPDRNRSGASNSLTLQVPLRVHRLENGHFCVEGTPTDCVHLAITGLLTKEPDLVVTGINHGCNLGDDVLYSGTVAAAMEGRFLGLPALAISIDARNPRYLETAVRVAVSLIRQLIQCPLNENQLILNVNVPDLPWHRLKGMQVTRLGHRHKAEPVLEARDPRGERIYWIGPPGAEQDAGPGTDFYALRQGWVSITPLQVDLTHQALREPLARWLPPLDHP